MATSADPKGNYQLSRDGDLTGLETGKFDLILSAFAFDNIPDIAKRSDLLAGLQRLLRDGGRILLLGSTRDNYLHEWVSFTTRDFPRNRHALSGDTVRIVMKDVEDKRPILDLVWFHEDYLHLFARSELDLIAHYTPLGRETEPYKWQTKTSIAPWFIYVLGKNVG